MLCITNYKILLNKGMQFTTVANLLKQSKIDDAESKRKFLSVDNFIFDFGY
jgi:hypothetical protein